MTETTPRRTPAFLHGQPALGDLDPPDVLAGETLAAPPRQERSRRTREALIAAARERFASHGYEATSVEDIAKDARIAVGGFYLHFRTKRQVLLMLVDRLLHELGSEPWSEPHDDAAGVMQRIARRIGREFAHAGVYRAWCEAASRDPSLAVLQERIEAWATAGIAAALDPIAASPRARPNVDVPTVSYMLSVVYWRLLDTEIADRAALSDTLVAALRHVLFEDAAPEPDEDA